MVFVKINNEMYPATVRGYVIDPEWDRRASKVITLEADYATASRLFVDGVAWSIIEQNQVPVFDENHQQIDTKIVETEYSNNLYNLAGDITDHRNGKISVKMGKLTALEEVCQTIYGGNN